MAASASARRQGDAASPSAQSNPCNGRIDLRESWSWLSSFPLRGYQGTVDKVLLVRQLLVRLLLRPLRPRRRRLADGALGPPRRRLAAHPADGALGPLRRRRIAHLADGLADGALGPLQRRLIAHAADRALGPLRRRLIAHLANGALGPPRRRRQATR